METTEILFHRIASDVNGNPRYVVDFLHFNLDEEKAMARDVRYALAVKRANSIGGRKFDRKTYAGGIVIQSYNIQGDANAIGRMTGRKLIAVRA